MEGPLRFTEVEHKYVVGEDFDLDAFAQALAGLGPLRTGRVQVRDRYFLTEAGLDRRFVIRHRFDTELHHLTLKALSADTEARTEVNLDLGQHAGDQADCVEAFLAPFGVRWSGTIRKDVRVWYFGDCEVVYYEARTDDRVVCCVEFEATRKPTLDVARAIVARYERATGFDPSTRSHRSLVELLFPDVSDRLR